MSRPKVEYFELDDDFSRPCFLSNDLTKYQCGKSHAKKISQRALRRKDIKNMKPLKKRYGCIQEITDIL
jgi:hypothetical protein